jgi:hypothetical protein
VVGEADNALLVYAAFTSRIQDDPLAVITRGRTASGKSTLLTRVGQMFPGECKIDVMRFTDASLFNAPEDYLTHKILITGERKHSTDDATRDANAMIRQLLSEKRITRSVSVAGEPGSGRWAAEVQERKGPVAYAESTTAGSIFEEDLNRMLQLYMDESREQTAGVVAALAARYDPDYVPPDPAAVFRRHHAFQRSLKPCRVVVSYGKALAGRLPMKKLEVRRAAQQVFSVIEAIALLHQHRRGRDDKGRLVATLDDYALARKLLLGPLEAALGAGRALHEFKRLRKALPAAGRQQFDSKEALEHFNNKVTRDKVLQELCELGLLKQVGPGGSHHPARWQWTGIKVATVLPPAAALGG